MENIREKLEVMNMEELMKVEEMISEIKKSKSKTLLISLKYNQYKGTGKCWVAIVNSSNKKIESFVDADSKQPRDNYSGEKTFTLEEGQYYLLCQSGSKRTDSREYVKVVDGELVEF